MTDTGDVPRAETYLREIARRVQALEHIAREALSAAQSPGASREPGLVHNALMEACAEARTLHLTAAVIRQVQEDARAALLAEQEKAAKGPRLRLLNRAAS
jgi:hypothetical protein